MQVFHTEITRSKLHIKCCSNSPFFFSKVYQRNKEVNLREIYKKIYMLKFSVPSFICLKKIVTSFLKA